MIPSCSELSVQAVSYTNNGLYTCTDERTRQDGLTRKVPLEWQTCGNYGNEMNNRQIAIITSPSLYVYVKGEVLV